MPNNLRYLSLFLLACISGPMCAQTPPRQTGQHAKPPVPPAATVPAKVRAIAEDHKGTLQDGNVYRNSQLDLTLALPGEWQFLDDQARDRAEGRSKAQQNDQACKGPFCGEPEINIALARSPEDAAPSAGTIFLAAFKLAPEYLDRGHYPLRHFAEVLLPGSSGKNGLVTRGDMAAIQLGGRPAYRVLVRGPNAQQPKEAGYVTESNGYMILLVGTTESASQLPDLQLAIESLQFSDSAAPPQ